jgi:hypothetical protein
MKRKDDGILASAAQAVGAALGTMALKTGLAKPSPAERAVAPAPRKRRPKAKVSVKRKPTTKKKALKRVKPSQTSRRNVNHPNAIRNDG